jgi:uncharacterized protein (TIGR00369 family)
VTFDPQQADGNVHEALGIEVVSASASEVVVRVAVGPRVHQPYGILHGGVSALIAESAASIGGALAVEPGKIVVGTELNCSHLRSIRTGTLTATAQPIRTGRTVHVWGIDLTNDEGQLICVARCSLAVLDAPKA